MFTANGFKDCRRGAAALLTISMMIVFVILAAVTVDYAHMQLVRSELRIATDAAAKAGAEALARTENETQATNAAIGFAASNTVGGKPLSLSKSDILFGRVAKSNNGKWDFQAGVKPYNSVQISSKISESLYFGRALDRTFFEPKSEAIAGYQELMWFFVWTDLDRCCLT